jgi:hypothetical protein
MEGSAMNNSRFQAHLLVLELVRNPFREELTGERHLLGEGMGSK